MAILCVVLGGCSCERSVQVVGRDGTPLPTAPQVTAHVAKIPNEIELRTVRSLEPGESGIVHRSQIHVDCNGLVFADKSAKLYENIEGACDVHVFRSVTKWDGVLLTLPDDGIYKWPREAGSLANSKDHFPAVSVAVKRVQR